MRLFAALRLAIPRVLPLMRHAGVPAWLKIASILSAIFIVSPLNVLGDIPLVGILDDAALLGILATLFVRVASAAVEKRVPEPKVVRPLPLNV